MEFRYQGWINLLCLLNQSKVLEEYVEYLKTLGHFSHSVFTGIKFSKKCNYLVKGCYLMKGFTNWRNEELKDVTVKLSFRNNKLVKENQSEEKVDPLEKAKSMWYLVKLLYKFYKRALTPLVAIQVFFWHSNYY
jgi:hypothetical protein